ncbi:YchF/TatD family DNA exonuclease [Candidatus Fermentibacteria bacterium]|nr:YchF/TatD family DNA exonuclease [Candidatus Fermentibacteria bacterium]
MSDSFGYRLFDTHAHLCFDSFDRDLEEVLRRARRAGVRDVLVPGTDPPSSIKAARMATVYEGLWAAVGVHPNEIEAVGDEGMEAIARTALRPRVVAIGETGMDLYRKGSPPAKQREWLRRHLELARALGRTLVAHSRAAEAEVVDAIGSCDPVPVVLHCYTGPVKLAVEAARRGCYVGLAGPVTYRSNRSLRELAGRLPPERMLIETDSPFLSPEPRRGSRNQPANLELVLQVVARAMGADPAGTASLLLDNSCRAFGVGEHRRTDLFYVLDGKMYVNLTGRCDNDCTFCIRNYQDGIDGYFLQHDSEPDPDRLRSGLALVRPDWFEEIVFCGYGEPTMRLGLLSELAEALSARGIPVRLNTNGLALSRIPEERVRRMVSLFDRVSVSLNAPDEESYRRISRPSAKNAWHYLQRFIDLCREIGCGLELTAVRGCGVSMKACEALAGSKGLRFRARG